MTRAGRRCLGATILLAGAALSGCGGETPVPTTPVLLDGWAAIHREIMVPSCAFGSCHGGAQPAARLDLSQPGSCAQLVGHVSCLFPRQSLVDPGAPEQSFLMAKLTGAGLDQLPETSCGGATNRRMPFGAMELAPDKIAAVRAWIASGAACDAIVAPPPAPDHGLAPGPADGQLPPPPPETAAPAMVRSLVAPAEPTLAGNTALLTITLAAPAPDGGAPIALQVSDPTILGAPATVLVPAGETTAISSIIGKRPGSVTVSASAGPGSPPATVTVRIGGLLLTEALLEGATAVDGAAWIKLANISEAPIDLADYRLSAGPGLVDDAAIRLSGILLPRTCLVTGGPRSSDDNGHPNLGLVWDFSGAVRPPSDGTPHPLVLALFDAGAPTAAVPVDAVAFGVNPTSLVGSDGEPLQAWPPPPPGHSAARAGAASWLDRSAPMPNACDFSLVER